MMMMTIMIIVSHVEFTERYLKNYAYDNIKMKYNKQLPGIDIFIEIF